MELSARHRLKTGVMRGKRAGIRLQLAHKKAIEDLLRNTSIPCL
jgi:hypothetical protein